jgi:hypothetical protein
MRMERIFTADVGQHFKAGDVRDYPQPTWEMIARSAKRDLDSFSRPVLEAAQAQVIERRKREVR